MRSAIDQYIIDRVRDKRIALKKTQGDLADALDFESWAYIGAIESMNPERTECYNIKQLNAIAKYLKVSPKDFWPEEPLTEYVSDRKYKPRKYRASKKH